MTVPRRVLLAAALFLGVAAVCAAPADARDLKRAAQVRLDAGLKAYGAGNYEQAIREFQAAYKIDPDPQLLYALAQAERLAERCGEALVHYRQFLESKPNEMQVEAARAGIALCEDKPEPPPPPPPEETPPPPELKVRPWYKDPANGLIVTGVASFGLGIGYVAASTSSRLGANRASTRDDFVFLRDRARSQRRLGVTAITVGVGLVGGGVAIHVLRDRKRASTPIVTTDGSSIYVAGTF